MNSKIIPSFDHTPCSAEEHTFEAPSEIAGALYLSQGSYWTHAIAICTKCKASKSDKVTFTSDEMEQMVLDYINNKVEETQAVAESAALAVAS